MFERGSLRSAVARPLAAGVAMALALSVAAPALAIGDTVTVTVTGEVEKVCEISPVTAPTIGSLAVAGSVDVDFDFNCNAPYAVSLVSARGAMASGAPATVGDFARQVPYQASATLPFDTTGAISLAPCGSAQLLAALGNAACGSGSSGGATSIAQRGALRIDWQAPADPLVAGEFGDVLTIRLSAEI